MMNKIADKSERIIKLDKLIRERIGESVEAGRALDSDDITAEILELAKANDTSNEQASRFSVDALVMPTDAEIREENYQKLMHQISIYSGKLDGGLATLQDLIHKLENGSKIKCECCLNRLDNGGRHENDCQIVTAYKEVFSG